MIPLTRKERLGIIFVAGSLLLGQAVVLYRKTAEVNYRYRASDGQVLTQVYQERTAAERNALKGRVVRARIDPNTASPEELNTLPGIGPELAGRIIAYREKQRFLGVDDLLKVKGIGPKKFEKIRRYLKVGA